MLLALVVTDALAMVIIEVMLVAEVSPAVTVAVGLSVMVVKDVGDGEVEVSFIIFDESEEVEEASIVIDESDADESGKAEDDSIIVSDSGEIEEGSTMVDESVGAMLFMVMESVPDKSRPLAPAVMEVEGVNVV